jgi:hypothetical protein
VNSLSAQQAAAQTNAEAIHYTRAGVWALLDAAELIYTRMRPRQRGRTAQAARVTALRKRLGELKPEQRSAS